MDTSERYTWFLLVDASAAGSPLVVIRDTSAGAWEGVPKALPFGGSPIGFWVVSSGHLGSVVPTSSGILVLPNLADAISSRCPDEVRVFSAVVAHPRDLSPPVPYALLRPRFGVSVARFAEPPAAFSRIGYVEESLANVVVNAALRDALESMAMPDLGFDEPKLG